MSLPKGILIRWANKEFNIMPLLEMVGMDNPYEGQLCFCPFHDDESGGKRSGKIFKEALHCYSEAKQYRAYDILVFLGHSDRDIEIALKSKGDVPDEILYGYGDIERIDLRNGDLLRARSYFMINRMSFIDYSDYVARSFVNSLLTRKLP